MKFNQSPKWAKETEKAPGVGHYNVKDGSILPYNKSFSISKGKFNRFDQYNSALSARVPGPGAYKVKKLPSKGCFIPRAMLKEKRNTNPGPGYYEPKIEATRGKSPSV